MLNGTDYLMTHCVLLFEDYLVILSSLSGRKEVRTPIADDAVHLFVKMFLSFCVRN